MINVIEDVVRQTYAELLARHSDDFCSCQQCRDDVVALALNHLRSRYVVGTPLGSAVTRVLLTQDSERAEVVVAVYGAMRKVGANPHRTGAYTPLSVPVQPRPKPR